MKIILDPGHGMSNRKPGIYDPGACASGLEEATIAMDWANELRAILIAGGHSVTRTRASRLDPAPVGQRALIAVRYGGEIMLSIHCNAADGTANGTETFHRGNPELARSVNESVVNALGTRDRGIKTESSSQHSRLAVMAFQPCVLLEIGFIDHAGDREKMTDPAKRKAACEAIAAAITGKTPDHPDA